MKRLFRVISVVISLLAATAAVAAAQSVSVSSVSGIVRDASGGALPGATVTIIKTDTRQARSVVTGPDGAYSIPGLPVGPYQLKVSLSGFTTYMRDGIVLEVGSSPAINITLAVGGVTER